MMVMVELAWVLQPVDASTAARPRSRKPASSEPVKLKYKVTKTAKVSKAKASQNATSAKIQKVRASV